MICHKNFRDLLNHIIEENGDRSAYAYFRGSNIEKVSYRQFGQDLVKLGSALCRRYPDQIHVGVIGENSYAWALIYFSTLYSGNVIVPIDKDTTERGLTNIINYSHLDVLFVEKKFAAKINEIKENIPHVDAIVPFNSINQAEDDQLRIFMKEPEGDGVPLHAIDADALAVLLFTSGTTGKSKGVMLSQRNLLADSNAFNALVTVPEHEKILSVLPMHHSFTLLCDLIRSVCIGGTVCISRGLRYLEEEMRVFRPYAINAVPLIAKNLILKARMLGDELACEKERIQCANDFFGGHLSFVCCGGAYITNDIIHLYRSMGIKLIRAYGITECSPAVSAMGVEGEYDDTTIGTILPCNEVRIKNGEIQVKGENVMIGYYNNPQETEKAIVDGWFSTGDIGYLKNKNLYICGRNKNIIILSNGKNVYPEEIEELFYEFKEILEVVVFELKRPNHDGVLVAILHVSQKTDHEKDAIKECVDRVNCILPAFKKIRKYYVCKDPFPKTSTNKIIREEAIKRGLIMEIEEQIYQIVEKSANCNAGDLNPDTNLFVDLGLDSIVITGIIMKCEKLFEIKIDESKIAELTTIGDMVKLVENEVNKNDSKAS